MGSCTRPVAPCRRTTACCSAASSRSTRCRASSGRPTPTGARRSRRISRRLLDKIGRAIAREKPETRPIRRGAVPPPRPGQGREAPAHARAAVGPHPRARLRAQPGAASTCRGSSSGSRRRAGSCPSRRPAYRRVLESVRRITSEIEVVAFDRKRLRGGDISLDFLHRVAPDPRSRRRGWTCRPRTRDQRGGDGHPAQVPEVQSRGPSTAPSRRTRGRCSKRSRCSTRRRASAGPSSSRASAATSRPPASTCSGFATAMASCSATSTTPRYRPMRRRRRLPERIGDVVVLDEDRRDRMVATLLRRLAGGEEAVPATRFRIAFRGKARRRGTA